MRACNWLMNNWAFRMDKVDFYFSVSRQKIAVIMFSNVKNNKLLSHRTAS